MTPSIRSTRTLLLAITGFASFTTGVAAQFEVQAEPVPFLVVAPEVRTHEILFHIDCVPEMSTGSWTIRATASAATINVDLEWEEFRFAATPFCITPGAVMVYGNDLHLRSTSHPAGTTDQVTVNATLSSSDSTPPAGLDDDLILDVTVGHWAVVGSMLDMTRTYDPAKHAFGAFLDPPITAFELVTNGRSHVNVTLSDISATIEVEAPATVDVETSGPVQIPLKLTTADRCARGTEFFDLEVDVHSAQGFDAHPAIEHMEIELKCSDNQGAGVVIENEDAFTGTTETPAEAFLLVFGTLTLGVLVMLSRYRPRS